MHKTPQGIVLYDGPSLINGDRIIVIATGFRRASRNDKTGKMLQTWILCADKPPMEANRCGDDIAICGTCKHRHFRSCYVNLRHGPQHVYDAWVAGVYTYLEYNPELIELFADKHIRIGSYGEPTAVLASVWSAVTTGSAGWTGYTHRWKVCSTDYRRFCMASCDTEDEAIDALARDWRPFYVRQSSNKIPPRFFICPASNEAGKKTTCQRCKACQGGEAASRGKFPTILTHGPSWKTIYYQRGMKRFLGKKRYVGVAWEQSPVK